MTGKTVYNRRERPAKPALTREGIVAAAVSVMRAEGIERVTMRRLATELDTGPASLYVYVRHTEALHAAMLDELLAEIDLKPRRVKGGWRERLWVVLNAYREVLFANPVLARVALVGRLRGPHYLAILDTVLGLLREGEMPSAQATWAVDMLLLVATASAVEHGSRSQRPGAEAEDEALAETVTGASPQRYPHVAALADELMSGTGPQRSRWAFEVLLNGALGNPPPGVTNGSSRTRPWRTRTPWWIAAARRPTGPRPDLPPRRRLPRRALARVG